MEIWKESFMNDVVISFITKTSYMYAPPNFGNLNSLTACNILISHEKWRTTMPVKFKFVFKQCPYIQHTKPPTAPSHSNTAHWNPITWLIYFVRPKLGIHWSTIYILIITKKSGQLLTSYLSVFSVNTIHQSNSDQPSPALRYPFPFPVRSYPTPSTVVLSSATGSGKLRSEILNNSSQKFSVLLSSQISEQPQQPSIFLSFDAAANFFSQLLHSQLEHPWQRTPITVACNQLEPWNPSPLSRSNSIHSSHLVTALMSILIFELHSNPNYNLLFLLI